MDRWREYLFRSHNEEELSNWARRLRHFRFCRALGGHANDGDQLILALRCDQVGELETIGRALGISTVTSGAHVVAGMRVFVSVYPDRIVVGLSGADGDPYEVTTADVRNAERLESQLELAILREIEPPVDDLHCVSPKFYPEFWKV